MEQETTVFDEAAYLAANPDVEAAVKAGAIESGEMHFVRYGYEDRRSLHKRQRLAPLALPFPADVRPNRRDRILAGLDVRHLEGLEIGALASPMVWPEEGNIFFVDHTDTKSLQDKYGADSSVDVANIVHVNAVWGEQTLEECVGVGKKFDYVVASHVIEHVPDLITWLSEIRTILRASGTLRLAIPDRRYTFDYLRFESRIHDVLDAYLQRARIPLPRLIIEHCSMIRIIDCAAAWNGVLDTSNLQAHSSTAKGLAAAKDAIANGTYHDSHCWVFTPVTFAELCVAMAELDMLGFACAHHFETRRNELEFIVHMEPSDSKADIIASWEKMKSDLLSSPTYQHEMLTRLPVKAEIVAVETDTLEVESEVTAVPDPVP